MAESNVPIPDPSLLTTEALMREIAHLRELTETADRHLLSRMSDMDLRLQQRYDASNKALDTALSSAKEAVSAALVAAEKAVAKAETAAEKRFDAVAEFREAYQNLISKQMPREEAENRLQALNDKFEDYKSVMGLAITDINSRLSSGVGRSAGIGASWGYLVGAVVLIGTLTTIFLALR